MLGTDSPEVSGISYTSKTKSWCNDSSTIRQLTKTRQYLAEHINV